MSDSTDAFADQDWMLLRCVPCQSLFRVSAEDAGLVVHCPQCREFLAIPAEWSEGVLLASPVPVAAGETDPRPGSAKPSPASFGPRKVRNVPVKAEAPKNLAAKAAGHEFAPLRTPGESFAIPPSRPKAEYQVPVLIVPNTNTVKSPPAHEKGERPRLEHLDRVATTSDARFIPDPNAPKPPRPIPLANGRRRGRSMVSWDEDEGNPEDESPSRPHPLRRSLAIAGSIAMALVIGTLLFHLLRDAAERSPEMADGTTGDRESPVSSGGDAEAREASSVLLDKLQNRIMPAASSFLDAPSVSERLAFVRDPERVRPLMERHAGESGADGPYPYRELGNLSSVLAAGKFYIVPVTLEDYTERKLAIEEVDGRYLVDWESFTAYSDLSFQKFIEEQPQEPKTFRTLAARADYFNYGFTEKGYACFSLLEPDTGQVLYGYARRDSPDPAQRLHDDIVRQEGAPTYVILRLRFPHDSKAPNQVIIDEYLQRGWVFRDDEDEPELNAEIPASDPSLPPSPASAGASGNSEAPSP